MANLQIPNHELDAHFLPGLNNDDEIDPFYYFLNVLDEPPHYDKAAEPEWEEEEPIDDELWIA